MEGGAAPSGGTAGGGGWTQSASPVTGLTGYHLEGQARPKRFARRMRNLCEKVAPTYELVARAASHTAAPTERQKLAGNYRKGRIKVGPLRIAIETPKGGERSGRDPDGTGWSVRMPAHYGYIERTRGADGDAIDVYVGPQPNSQTVFVIDQVDADTHEFDEHKLMLGYPGIVNALADYDAAFSDGKGPLRRGAVTPITLNELRTWLRTGDTQSPFASRPPHATRPVEIVPKEGSMSRLYKNDVINAAASAAAQAAAAVALQLQAAAEPAPVEAAPVAPGAGAISPDAAPAPVAAPAPTGDVPPAQAEQAGVPPEEMEKDGAPEGEGPEGEAAPAEGEAAPAEGEGNPEADAQLGEMLDALGASVMSIMKAPPADRRQLLGQTLEQFAAALVQMVDGEVQKAFYAGAHAALNKSFDGGQSLRKGMNHVGQIANILDQLEAFCSDFQQVASDMAADAAWGLLDMGSSVLQVVVADATGGLPAVAPEAVEEAPVEVEKSTKAGLKKGEAEDKTKEAEGEGADETVADKDEDETMEEPEAQIAEGDELGKEAPFVEGEGDMPAPQPGDEGGPGPAGEDAAEGEQIEGKDIAKEEFSKMAAWYAGQVEDVQAKLTKLEAENATLRKNTPAPAKGTLRAIDKAADATLVKGFDFAAEAARLDKLTPELRAAELTKFAMRNGRSVG